MAGATNFTSGTETTAKFGVHEVVLTGDGSVANPFDTVATVTFVPPSGARNSRKVWAFYDGDNTWRARVYTTEAGPWTWSSACSSDRGLDAHSGKFHCNDSRLRGRLLIHPKNPHQWMTEDGRWFLNLNDTAYFLLSSHDGLRRPIPEADFQAYVRDAVDHGITSFRCDVCNGPGTRTESTGGADNRAWNKRFSDDEFTRPDLQNLQVADHRLRWLLDHNPDVYVQLILLPLGKPYAEDETFWAALAADKKERLLRNLVARYAAYPGIFWLVTNDCIYTIPPDMLSYAESQQSQAKRTFPNVEAMAMEVGAFFHKHDPWQHPLSTGPARTIPFPFGREEWATYIHLEHAFDFGAKGVAAHLKFNKPVFLGEDRYEQDHPKDRDPVDMRYFQRRLFWSWLLAGGSANYGGRWWSLDPYGQTGDRPIARRRTPDVTFGQLVGLDSVKFIRNYFTERHIELSDFESADELIKDSAGATAGSAPRMMRRGGAEFLAYHPHATSDDRQAHVQAATSARMRVDLRGVSGTFLVEWYRAEDGRTQQGQSVSAADWRELTAPWQGADVVLRLLKE